MYHYHAFLGMLAPAAAEVVLARTLLSSGEAKKVLLDDCLIGDEGKSLELQLGGGQGDRDASGEVL